MNSVVDVKQRSGSWYRSQGVSGACSLPSDKVNSIKAGWNYRKWSQSQSEGLAAGDKVPVGIVVCSDEANCPSEPDRKCRSGSGAPIETNILLYQSN